MLTKMIEEQLTLVVGLFRLVCPQRGEKGHDDRRFLEALHYFTVHNMLGVLSPASSAIGIRPGSASGDCPNPAPSRLSSRPRPLVTMARI
jgi:hypothetical protein